MHSPSSFGWRGRVKRARSVVPSWSNSDQVVALPGRLPVAVGRLRAEDVLGLAHRQHPLHHRPQLLLRPAEEIVQLPALLPEAPLELIEAPLIHEGHDRLRRGLDHAGTPEGRIAGSARRA